MAGDEDLGRVTGPIGPVRRGHLPCRVRDDRLIQEEEVERVNDFFRIIAAGPAFFVSAWLLMIFAGIVGTDVGIRPFGYITSMVVTIGLWLVVAPAAGAITRVGGKKA